jgi:thiosulfate/3-mercaptopyruvate sulfurtransferase
MYLDTDRLETGRPTWNLRDDDQLQETFGELGLESRAPIVVTGRSMIAAARVAWTLRYVGAERVSLLSDGLTGWIRRGYPTATRHVQARSVRFAGTVRKEMRASLWQLENAADAWIADVRSPAEFRGEVSGYSYLAARGRIPGSIHAGDADDHAGVYVDADGRLSSPETIAALWESRGLHLNATATRFEKDVVFVCGGGWRASLAYWFAYSLGIRNAKVCPEGWGGWSTVYAPDSASPSGYRQLPTGRLFAIG